MKRLMLGAAVAALALAACSKTETAPDGAPADVAATPAATGIDGTWKLAADSAQFQTQKPYSVTVKDGTWTCNSCLPPFSVPADGQWHKVDRPVADEIMVKLVDDKTMQTASRKAGKDIARTTWTVAADGKSMTNESWEAALEGGEEVTAKNSFTRKGEAVAGAHMVSGEWQIAKIEQASDSSMMFTVSTTPDSFTLSANGEGYTAKLGGEPVAIKGNLGGAMAAVEKVSDTEYLETITRKGEVIGTNRITLNPDGTMSLESSDPRTGNVTRFKGTRA